MTEIEQEQNSINANNIVPGSIPPANSASEGSNANMSKRRKQPTADQLGPKQYCWGTGRRKKSIARVRLRPGSGKILINNREVDDYFPRPQDQHDLRAPLAATSNLKSYDVFVKLHGGGITGQAGAAMLGIARALIAADPDTFPVLRDKGYLTRDSRQVERKKYGKKKARKSFQFSKR